MIMKKQYIILILCFFVGTINLMGQTKNAYISAAQQAYENENYYTAFSYYQEVLKFDVNDLGIYYQAANAARQFRAYKLADTLYSQVLEGEDDNQFPKATFYAAEIKQKLGQYEKAKEYYSLYISEQGGNDTFLTEKAKMEIKSIDWALRQISNSNLKKDTVKRLKVINSPYSDFGAYKKSDTLFFSSLRFTKKVKGVFPDKTYSRIMISLDSTDKGDVYAEDLISKPTDNIAHTTFNGEHSQMYFTICEYVTADKIRCDLYSVNVEKGEPVGSALKIPIGQSDSTTHTEPAWGKLDGKEVLFFVSDRAGGKGMKDLWYVEIKEENTYGEPVNLKKINTAYNDITPYYDGESSILYFSSTGYLGFGGYDIYSSQYSDGKWTDAHNVGVPLNSSYNDIYPMIASESDKVYFSSNRPGSLYLDEGKEGCCYDIYKGELPFLRHKLIVQVYDQYTKEPVYGAEVSLSNAKNEKLITSKQDPDSMQYSFRVQRNKQYIIQGIKEGYLPEIVNFSTVNVPDTGDIIKKIYLKTEDLHLDVFVFDGRDSTALRGAEVTLIDSDGNTIDKINLNSNDFHFVLDRDEQYTIIASRKGFNPVSVEVDASLYENKSRIIRNLYLPLGELEDFLPLVLYFDNDRPVPNSWARNTDILYTETFPPYYNRKDVFIDKFTAPLEGEVAAEEAANQLDNFFNTEVKKGYEDLQSFIVVLERVLKEGKNVDIYLKGYTSPRSTRAYNFSLGMRRVQSVKNNLVKYNEGSLMEYIKSGQLEVRLKSFGETTSPSDVPDKLSDERNSIYSYKASKERRVEIIDVNIGD